MIQLLTSDSTPLIKNVLFFFPLFEYEEGKSGVWSNNYVINLKFKFLAKGFGFSDKQLKHILLSFRNSIRSFIAML